MTQQGPVTQAAQGAASRTSQDWQNAQSKISTLNDTVTQLGTLVDEAAALDVTQNREIADLKAERDQLLADAQEAIGVLNAIDPDTAFPQPSGGDGGTGTTPTPPQPSENQPGGNNPPPPPAPGEDIPVGTGAQDTGGAPPAPPEVTNPDTAPQPTTGGDTGTSAPGGDTSGTGDGTATPGTVNVTPDPSRPPGE